jgi:lipid-A-disaccharide synthase
VRILLSAGETSGDRIGARIASDLFAQAPCASIAGCAGPAMLRAGVHPLARAAAFSHSGWESLVGRAPQLLWAAWRYLRRVREFRPDLAVVVDAPGLHGPLLSRLRGRGTRCAWIAPPQLWAWKRRNLPVLVGLRVHPLHEFELDPLRCAGADAAWLGYPGPRPSRADGPRDVLALLPGSRVRWRRIHSGLFREAARLADTGLEPVLVHPDPPAGFESGLRCMPPEDALARAAMALSLPGTSTLEIALQGIPAVVAARPGPLDSRIAAARLAPGPVSLPSRILGRPCVPELLGAEATADRIARALRDALPRAGREPAFDDLRERLGPQDASARIAADVLARA